MMMTTTRSVNMLEMPVARHRIMAKIPDLRIQSNSSVKVIERPYGSVSL